MFTRFHKYLLSVSLYLQYLCLPACLPDCLAWFPTLASSLPSLAVYLSVRLSPCLSAVCLAVGLTPRILHRKLKNKMYSTVSFIHLHRELIQESTFYHLFSPYIQVGASHVKCKPKWNMHICVGDSKTTHVNNSRSFWNKWFIHSMVWRLPTYSKDDN